MWKRREKFNSFLKPTAYSHTELLVPAGFWTYAAVAWDNAGAFSADTVSISVLPHYVYSTLPIPSGKTRVSPKAINEAGTVVGFAHSGNESAIDTRAASWSGGNLTLLNLNHLVLQTVATLRDPRAINNRGQIVGTGFSGSTQILYFLDPLPGLRHSHWLATHFTPAEIEAGVITGDLADADNDTLSNLLERALGLNPRVAFQSVPGATPTAEIGTDNRLYFSYRRLRPPRDIQYTPEFSTNLETNNWDASVLETFSVETINDELELVTVRTIAPLPAQDRAFIRLEVGR